MQANPVSIHYFLQNVRSNQDEGINAETCFLDADEQKYAHQGLANHVFYIGSFRNSIFFYKGKIEKFYAS